MKALTIVLLGNIALLTAGCAVTTASLPTNDERSVTRSVNDMTDARAVSARMLRAYDYDFDGVTVEATEGVVILTGHVPTQKDKLEAERIAWSAPNVDQVGNEIVINGGNGFIDSSKDLLLNTAVRTRLTADKYVKSMNINIQTYDGVVYLLGVARNSQELERITRIASETNGAKEVVSYIRLARNKPQYQDSVVAESAVPTNRRQLPQSLSTTPQYSAPSVPSPAPHIQTPSAGSVMPYIQQPEHAAPEQSAEAEPYYVDPKTGQRIILPPGTVTVPYDPNMDMGTSDEPYYIDPDTGQRIKVVYKIVRPVN